MRPFALLAILAVVAILGSSAAADRSPAAAPAQAAVPSRPTAPSASPPGSQPAPPAPPASSPAQPAPLASRLTPIEPSAVPEACQPLAKQALAAGPAALSARISLAVCMADRAVAPLSLCDCGESILAVDTAIEPALALLDEVIDAGDPASQLIAEHAEGELHAGVTARLLATLPAPPPGASAAETALREMRRQTLDAQLEPWRDAAARSFQHVVELARAHPELAERPAVRTAVRDSQQRLKGPAAS
ncbi:MAG TPA: hypothetical protein VHT91_14940 [Kofleriaceae bacterium]|jgi:hypothetical protein|nr:hypothetical protein [Kofleriaceae bacterium]